MLLSSGLAACSRQYGTLSVVLPSEFHGHVTISCTGLSDANTIVRLDGSGYSSGVPCPKNAESVTVVRDGKSLIPEGGIQAMTTGDKLTVGYQFDVR